MEQCTWKGCQATAIRLLLDRDGKRWANLCEAHHKEYEGSFVAGPKALLWLRCWVLAQGGAEAAAKRMAPEFAAISQRLVAALEASKRA